METKQELMQKLQSRLSALQDGKIKVLHPTLAKLYSMELSLLYCLLKNDLSNDMKIQIQAEMKTESGVKLC